MTKKAYTRVITRPLETEDPRLEQVERFVQSERAEPRHRFVSIAEKLAKSSLYHRNLYLKELSDLGKYDDDLARIDILFPYCEGGPLYVDEVTDDQELEKAMRKKPLLLAAGIRYVILDDSDKIDIAIDKLAEVDRVLDKRSSRASSKAQ